MFVKLDLIAQIIDPKRKGLYTHYFFSKKYGILLPIENKRSPYKLNPLVVTLSQILNNFCIEIKKVIIYLHKENKYYSYLSLVKDSRNFEFNCDLFEILYLHRELNYPIYINRKLLIAKGIKVTKRMILKAMEGEYYLS